MMSKFVFKLQTLLNLKIQMEESTKNELGKAIQELEREKEILSNIEKEKENYIEMVKEESRKGVAVRKIIEINDYILRLKDKIELQKENVNYAQKNVDKYREQLINIMQEKQMLEKLKEKKYEEYKYEEMKKEQSQVDEIVSYKYSSQEN